MVYEKLVFWHIAFDVIYLAYLFRVVLLLFPLLTFVYEHYGYAYATATWILKIPYWLVLIWVAYRELRLIANVIEPPQHQVNIVTEWTSRALQLVLITFLWPILVSCSKVKSTSDLDLIMHCGRVCLSCSLSSPFLCSYTLGRDRRWRYRCFDQDTSYHILGHILYGHVEFIRTTIDTTFAISLLNFTTSLHCVPLGISYKLPLWP